MKIILTSEEFLSGFHKGDRLIPVITAVILSDPDEWDAPMSIHEMPDVDVALLPFIPDYRIITSAIKQLARFYDNPQIVCY